MADITTDSWNALSYACDPGRRRVGRTFDQCGAL